MVGACVSKVGRTENYWGVKLARRAPSVQSLVVELKAEMRDLQEVRGKLIRCGAEKIGVFHQVDTYYGVPKGRLKLREETDHANRCKLIYYEREDIAGPKKSSVFILAIPQPQVLKPILQRIIKVKAVVEKMREIYLLEEVQIHLDTVRGLGCFVEFERLTSQDLSRQEKDTVTLEKLRKQLNISPQRLIKLSYSDLMCDRI